MTQEDKIKFFDRIEYLGFPLDQFYSEMQDKFQLVFHFTVSGKGAKGDINWWLQDSSRIATCAIIDWRGIFNQLFSTSYWGWHIGAGNINLEKYSIGIEIDSWGPLMEKDGFWYPVKKNSWTGKYQPNIKLKPIPSTDICFFKEPWRGFIAYEKFTKEQIETCRLFCLYCNEKFKIPLDYKEEMWDVSESALRGEPGIWTHASYIDYKTDCMPQPEFIEMLKSLKQE